MVEILSRQVVENGIIYVVRCIDGKERQVNAYLLNPSQRYREGVRVNTYAVILKNGQRFGRDFHVTRNPKVWGDFEDVLVAELAAEFPNGYEVPR